MAEVIEFFKKIQPRYVMHKNIQVYTINPYQTTITTSVTKFLFEPLEIIENIAPKENHNRDGRKKKKSYITIHETGEENPNSTAEFWNKAVVEQKTEDLFPYKCSFHYVVGNDGIYHNIPDAEVAYHAGDGLTTEYDLIDTELPAENVGQNTKVTISSDGFYEINGKKSAIAAPKRKLRKDGKIVFSTPQTSDIVTQGIRCKVKDGKYFIGKTYYNIIFQKIANFGGNLNSIGIESCDNKGSDLILTWQRVAKLTAYLIYKNDLDFDDVKQHNYFSGKECPQTLRMNNLFHYFMELVKAEYQILLFQNQGYEISMTSNDPRVSPNGRVQMEEGNEEDIIFTIEVKKNGHSEKGTFSIFVQ